MVVGVGPASGETVIAERAPVKVGWGLPPEWARLQSMFEGDGGVRKLLTGERELEGVQVAHLLKSFDVALDRTHQQTKDLSSGFSRYDFLGGVREALPDARMMLASWKGVEAIPDLDWYSQPISEMLRAITTVYRQGMEQSLRVPPSDMAVLLVAMGRELWSGREHNDRLLANLGQELTDIGRVEKRVPEASRESVTPGKNESWDAVLRILGKG